MIESRVIVGERIDEADDVAAALHDARASQGIAWLDVAFDDDEGIAEIARQLGWKSPITEALHHVHKRARLERTAEHTALLLMPARYDDASETVELAPLAVVADASSVVTVRGSDWIDVGRIVELLHGRHAGQAAANGLVWAICAEVVEAYAPVIEGVENDIDEIEEKLFTGPADVSRRIFSLQRELVRLQHATEPLPGLLDALAEGAPAGGERAPAGGERAPAGGERAPAGGERAPADGERAPAGGEGAPAGGEASFAARFRSTSAAAAYVVRRVSAFRATLDSALTVHSSLVGEQSNAEMQRMTEFSITQNDQVKRISSWAAIGFAPTLIASIYGMNFHVMPELAWPWGYPMALALMAAVGAGLYWVFRRHDWL